MFRRQALSGYEAILRVVCTPDVLLTSSDLFASLHARARRRFEKGIASAAARRRHRQRIIKRASQITIGQAVGLGGAALAAVDMDISLGDGGAAGAGYVVEQQLRDGDEAVLAAERGDACLGPAESAAELDVADATALCLWLAGCLLAHFCGGKGAEEFARGKTVQPHESLAAFSAKLLRA